MNSIAGKSTGIALLMAAAMLAALFAMGVFSATGVGAHQPGESHPIAETTDDHRHATLDSLSVQLDTADVTPTYLDEAGDPQDLSALILETVYEYTLTVAKTNTSLTLSPDTDGEVDAVVYVE